MSKSVQKRVFLFFLLPRSEKIMPKMKFLEKNIARAMATKMQNWKKEGFSY
jgi:hypothetical protein